MKVSIVIPVYNKAEFISNCLDNLLQQDFDDFEVITVDDGSTDDSGRICDNKAAQYARIKVIHTENGGVTAARRKGVEQATGDYIMFVDADDGLLPGAIKTLYDAITESDADEVIATFTTHLGVLSPVVYEGFVNPDELIRYIITNKNRFPVLWSILFRRELLSDVLDTPREIVEGEDKLMQVKILLKHPKVYFISKPAYIYTLGLPNSRSHTLEREVLYDKLLETAMGPRIQEFNDTLTLHKIKEYERFIYDGNDSVRKSYYLSAVGKPSSAVPLYDRLVFLLPPVLARPIIKLYRKLITIKQKGL